MHNGNIGGFDKVRRKLMDRLNDACFEFAVANGASDTVVCFALFLNTFHDHMATVSPDVLRKNTESVVELIVATCQECDVQETSLLNFVISDGLSLLATRFVYDPMSPNSSPASLYFGAGTAYESKRTTTACPGGAVVAGTGGEYGMTHTDRRIKVVIVTSEPLSDNHTDWVAVPSNNILVVTPDLHLLLAPIGSSASMSSALENILSMERKLLPIELQDALGPVASRAVLGGMEGGREGGREGNRSQNRRVSHSPQKEQREEGEEDGDGVEGGAEGGGVVQRARHVILGHCESALALAVSGPYLFSGSQDGSIRVWNIETFTLDAVVACADEGHSVLALVVHKDLLYTTSSDNKLRAWGLTGREGGARGEGEGGGSVVLLGVVFIEGMGHPISLAVAAAPGEEEGGREGGGSANGNETVYMGFQDTSVRRIKGSVVRFPPSPLPPVPLSLPTQPNITDPSSPLSVSSPYTSSSLSPSTTSLHHHLRPPKSGSSTPKAPVPPPASSSPPSLPERLGLGDFESQHCGPVTALTLYPPYIVSGAGDGFVKVWSPATKTCVRTLQGHHGSVLTLLAGREEGVVISGSRDGTIKVWDMESFSCRRTLRGHNDDVLSLAIWAGWLFSGAADGCIVVWRLETLTFYRAFQQAEQAVQSLVVSSDIHQLLFSGLEGGMVLAWDMPHEVSSNGGTKEGGVGGRREEEGGTGTEFLRMEECLSELVGYQSVSVSEEDFHKEECWRCAKFLTSLLERLGASVKMVSVVEGRSPVVLARFGNDPSKPTVTMYGHYDVVPATERTWKTVRREGGREGGREEGGELHLIWKSQFYAPLSLLPPSLPPSLPPPGPLFHDGTQWLPLRPRHHRQQGAYHGHDLCAEGDEGARHPQG